MINEQKFKDLLTVLFTNNISKDGSYIVPFRFNQKDSKGQPINPVIPTKETLDTQLTEIVVWAEKVLSTNNILNWEHDQSVFELIFRSLFYDGKGFMLPYFQGYINKKTEHQQPNDTIEDSWGKPVNIYNFDKDTAAGTFFQNLFYHLNNWEVWLKEHAESLGQHPTEWIEEKNTDDTGMKELQEPYEKLIDNLQNEQEKL